MTPESQVARTGVAVPVRSLERMARANDLLTMVAESLADLARAEALQAAEETRLYLRARTRRAESAGVTAQGYDTLARLAAMRAESHEDSAVTLYPDAVEARIPGSAPLA